MLNISVSDWTPQAPEMTVLSIEFISHDDWFYRFNFDLWLLFREPVGVLTCHIALQDRSTVTAVSWPFLQCKNITECCLITTAGGTLPVWPQASLRLLYFKMGGKGIFCFCTAMPLINKKKSDLTWKKKCSFISCVCDTGL